ncbi:MAG: GntR family transcriptional regulator [Sebaldella sp.]|nr:GntR family transcriptional regulator [Sebaldella sp.]
MKLEAYNYLKEKIINNKISPNEILNERSIAKELNMSTTPIKEALLRLELENHVQIFPRRGIYVKEVNLKLIKDIFQARMKLEPVLVELTVQSMERKLLLKNMLNLKKEFLDISKIKNLDTETFDTVYESFRYFFTNNCNNLYLTNQMNVVYNHLHRIRKSLYKEDHRRLEGIGESIKIIDAIMEEKSIEKIKNLCEIHIENAQGDFFSNLDNLKI